MLARGEFFDGSLRFVADFLALLRKHGLNWMSGICGTEVSRPFRLSLDSFSGVILTAFRPQSGNAMITLAHEKARWQRSFMEATLNLAPSALDRAQQVAALEGISLDDAISQLILQAVTFRDEAAAGFKQLDEGESMEVDRAEFFREITGQGPLS